MRKLLATRKNPIKLGSLVYNTQEEDFQKYGSYALELIYDSIRCKEDFYVSEMFAVISKKTGSIFYQITFGGKSDFMNYPCMREFEVTQIFVVRKKSPLVVTKFNIKDRLLFSSFYEEFEHTLSSNPPRYDFDEDEMDKLINDIAIRR